MRCSLSVHAGNTMMIVMEYMGNGVLDSFLRVSAVEPVGTAGLCHPPGFHRHRSALAFPPLYLFIYFLCRNMRDSSHPPSSSPCCRGLPLA